MSATRTAVILGSTGAVGTSQVERFSADPTTQVVALAAAGRDLPALARQAVQLGVFGLAVGESDLAAVNLALDEANEEAGADVRPEILIGPDVTTHAAGAGVDVVVNAIKGMDGIGPSLEGLRTGAHVEVANTETLLSAALLTPEVLGEAPASHRLSLLSPDLGGLGRTLVEHDEAVARVILTAPAHPRLPARHGARPRRVNQMTGFAAGFALLEVGAISQVPIDVVTHTGGVGALVELEDGRTVAHPRTGAPAPWERATSWWFEPARLPAVDLCRAAASEGGTYPIVAYRANDAAVAAFLDGAAELEEIVDVVARVLDAHEPPATLTLDALHGAAVWAKKHAREILTAGR